jgi:hypothetical protein
VGNSLQKFLEEPVVLIRSNDNTYQTFGTGFSVGGEGQATYIVTCAHVVEEISDEIRDKGNPSVVMTVDGVPATVVSSGFQNGIGIDLAVLRVEKSLGHLPLRGVPRLKGKPFTTSGWQQVVSSGQFIRRQLNGFFGGPIHVGNAASATFTKAWDLEIKSEHFRLQEGYSGSPVADKNGHVVAVVNTREGKGIIGTAISIEALKNVWPNMPSDLFWQPPQVLFVNWLNRRLVPVVNWLNMAWGILPILLLLVALVIGMRASANPDQLTFANNLAIIAYYLALGVFCIEVCALVVHGLAVHQLWRWLLLTGLVVVGIAIYSPGIILSWGGLAYYLIATLVPCVLSFVLIVALRWKSIAPQPALSQPASHFPQ